MIKHLFRKLSAAVTALAVTGVAALALTSPPTFAPRNFQNQQVAYFRINVNFNSINGQPCVLVSNKCTIKVGALPYNAYVIRATQQIITNFNSGTTDTVALGISSASANELVAAQSVHTGAGNQSTLTVASAGSGVQVTGNSASQTGTDGGFDLYVLYAQTGSAPTAGQAIIILEYIPANDGTCAEVAMGATAGAC
jgi:hypothetical protein